MMNHLVLVSCLISVGAVRHLRSKDRSAIESILAGGYPICQTLPLAPGATDPDPQCTVTCPTESTCAGFAGKSNSKCKPSNANCNMGCGWLSCPGCSAWTPETCPPDDSVLCSDLTGTTANSEDPLACAAVAQADDPTSIMDPNGESCENDLNSDGYTDRDECIDITGSGGNRCMWFSFMDTSGNVNSGRCGYNACSNVNDGSCTLQQTGNRCVWYGNPNNLRTIDGVKEAPNPYQNTSGCYISPCNNPAENNPQGCQATNVMGFYNGDETDTRPSPYQCQWCQIDNIHGMNMGCQNIATTSVARASNIAAFPEQGGAPCLNDFCNYFYAPGRTNNNVTVYPALGNRTAVEAFGDGSLASQKHCN